MTLYFLFIDFRCHFTFNLLFKVINKAINFHIFILKTKKKSEIMLMMVLVVLLLLLFLLIIKTSFLSDTVRRVIPSFMQAFRDHLFIFTFYWPLKIWYLKVFMRFEASTGTYKSAYRTKF